MNYPQFFAILSNQCSRFANEVQVPTDIERVLDELRATTNLGQLDEPLRLAFTALLTPRFVALLTEAHGAVTDMVQERIAVIDKQRADAVAEFQVTQQAAVDQAQSAQKQHQDMLTQLGEQQSRIAALEQQIATLKV